VTTGLQSAHVGLIAALERWREQLSPREYAVLLDLFIRWAEAERERNERAQRRWAA
jgi:hypothetical protein